MSFTQPSLNEDETDRQTRNRAGGVAFEAATPQRRLYKLVTANLVEDTYYRSDEGAVAELVDSFVAAANSDPEFVLQLASFVRDELGQRAIPQYLLVFASYHDQTKPYVREYAPAIMRRADEPCTVLELHDEYYDGVAPKPLRKGIEDALHQFDAYQFAKYDSDNASVNLRDVVNRVHPTPRDDQRDRIFERLIRGPLDAYEDVEPLEPPSTWETTLSAMDSVTFASDVFSLDPNAEGRVAFAKGTGLNDSSIEVSLTADGSLATLSLTAPSLNDTVTVHLRSVDEDAVYSGFGAYSMGDGDEVSVPLPSRRYGDATVKARVVVRDADEKAAWEAALPDMGLFAKMRNIRNMVYAGVDDADIFDEDDLSYAASSRILPFRFYQAYRALEDEPIEVPAARDWLSEAVAASMDALPDDLDDTFVAVDLSGSMSTPLSDDSAVTYLDISAFFGGLFMAKGADVGVFGREYAAAETPSTDDPMELADYIADHQSTVGAGGTEGWRAMRSLTENNETYDRIVFLTDEQLWDSSFSDHNLRDEYDAYTEAVDDAPLYVIDLASYGTLSVPETHENVYRVGGWSEDVIRFFQYAEDEEGVIERIREEGGH